MNEASFEHVPVPLSEMEVNNRYQLFLKRDNRLENEKTVPVEIFRYNIACNYMCSEKERYIRIATKTVYELERTEDQIDQKKK